jgi:hypothetical protein
LGRNFLGVFLLRFTKNKRFSKNICANVEIRADGEGTVI